MAKKSKSEARDRRATLEAMRRQQQARERRKTMLVVGIASILGLALIALAAVPAVLNRINDPARKAPASFGVAAPAAACEPEVVDTSAGESDHVPSGTRVDYPDFPPSSGRHDGSFLTDPQEFYERGQRPPVEKMVHELEHGYTVVWYGPGVTGQDLETLRDLSKRMGTEPATRGKFIAAPWEGRAENRGDLPEGKSLALTHWGAGGKAYRQYCGAVSGEAIASFVQRHPSTDAPEPNGA